LQEAVCKEPEYLLTELDIYSMQDLVQVKSGEMTTNLREIVSRSSQHVADCQVGSTDLFFILSVQLCYCVGFTQQIYVCTVFVSQLGI
jgi:hypothetical protein